ncbi:MAG: PspA/IM30 family protein [Bryobacterales bacterium]|nr:PspA/IM30 family protein [Bryobacterales bacterium]
MEFLRELWKRLRRKDKDAAENMRDYVADAREAIEARKREIIEFRGKVAEVNQAKRVLERQLGDTDAELAKWNATLENIKASNLDLEAKKEKGGPVMAARNSAAERAEGLRHSIQAQDEMLVQLRKQLMEAQTDLADREQKLVTLAARHHAVKIRKGLNDAAAAFATGKSTLSAVDQLEQKVMSEEDRAAALAEEIDLTKPGSEAAAIAAQFDPKRMKMQDDLDNFFGGAPAEPAAEEKATQTAQAD